MISYKVQPTVVHGKLTLLSKPNPNPSRPPLVRGGDMLSP